jgi:transcriptional regulator with XRE-family HTH domain
MARDSIPTFPARLRELRELAGLTGPQLAERAGTSKDSISKLERGDRAPSFRLAAALAAALAVSCDDLLRPSGETAGKKSRKK